MKILLTNDDGIDATGIMALCKAVSKEHTVYIVAPDSNRSACGHSITMSKPLILRQIDLSQSHGCHEAYSLSGTPADCVKYAVLELFGTDCFDLVLSGINNGPNIGTDLMYSGTVSAAFEGAYLGLKAIAVSYFDWHATLNSFGLAADFVSSNLAELVPLVRPNGILNINVPPNPKGYRVTTIGHCVYNDKYEDDSGGKRLVGDMIRHANNIADSDVELLNQGYITISPATMDRNDYKTLDAIRDINLKF